MIYYFSSAEAGAPVEDPSSGADVVVESSPLSSDLLIQNKCIFISVIFIPKRWILTAIRCYVDVVEDVVVHREDEDEDVVVLHEDEEPDVHHVDEVEDVGVHHEGEAEEDVDQTLRIYV
jgi:hypothetical protein